MIRILLCHPPSPGSHDDGPLSRVDGEAVGDGPLVFTLLHLQTTERNLNRPGLLAWLPVIRGLKDVRGIQDFWTVEELF